MIAAEPKTTGQYQPYPEYKDSGVEWLGEVPTNWSVATLRHALAGIKNGSTATQLDEGIDTVQISRIETISTGEINHDKVGFVEFVDALHHYRLNVGDILFSHINSLPMVGNIAQYCSKIPLYHGMNLLRLQPSAKVESRYLYWWLKSTFSRQSVESLAKPAINQASIAIDQIKSIPCLYPMWDEQCIIAAFLDYETARIDRLIAQQQRLIELLKEKRQAVISHAVTKGLNPYAPMKDSGVEWLGQVPEHWVVTYNKYLVQLTPKKSQITLDREQLCSFIPMEKLKQDTLILDEQRVIGDVFDGYTYFEDEDILLAKVTPCFENKNSVVARGLINGVGFGSTEIFVLRCNSQINNDFMYYRLQEGCFMDTATAAMTGAGGLKRVPSDVILNYKIALPPIEEQLAIVKALKNQLDACDKLIERAFSAIALMQERRIALISAAVTGKIDLRGWTQPAEEVAA